MTHIYMQGDMSSECSANVDAAVSLFSELRFSLHDEKICIQTQSAAYSIFLGFS